MRTRILDSKMSKYCIIGLLVSFMLAMLFIWEARANGVKGDINNDGTINVIDLVKVIQEEEGADLNGDYRFTNTDSRMMRYKLIGTIDSFQWHYSLNGTKGTDATGSYLLVSDVETIQIGEETQVATVANSRGLARPGAVFSESNSIDWENQKTLSFKVYNPTDYTMNFDIKAYKYNYPEEAHEKNYSVRLRGVTLQSGETTTVTIYEEQFDATTYPYIGFSPSLDYHGGDTTRNNALKLYFYDFTEGTAIQPTTDDYAWTKIQSGLRAEPFTAINTNATYVQEGTYSLFVVPSANWPTFRMDKLVGCEWSNVEKITFAVYNPTEQTLAINLYRTDGTNTLATTKVELAAKQWTTVEYSDLSDWATGNHLEIAPDSGANSGDAWTALKDQGIYLDNFKVIEKTYYELDGTVAGSFEMLTGVESITVGNVTTTAAYAAFRSSTSYIRPKAVFKGSDSIAWADNKAVSFKVYNPTDYDYNFDIRAYKEGYSTTSSYVVLQGTTVKSKEVATVTIYGSMFDATTYPYLGIYAPIEYHNHVQGTVSDRFQAMKLYFYDFEETTEIMPTTDDYAWTKIQSGLRAEQFTAINTNATYVQEGTYSLFVVPSANWPTFRMDKLVGCEWSNVEKITFAVYNPTEQTLAINLYRTDGTNTLATTKVELAAKQWTTVEYSDLSDWATGNHLEIAPDSGANSGDAWTALKEQGIYLDDFKVTTK